MNYGWNLEDPEDYDLTTCRSGKHYDIVYGVDGWVIYTPFGNWVHNGSIWLHEVNSRSARGKKDAVTREEARRFAEQLIDLHEGKKNQ
jgi:hypothetical protein